MAVLMEPMPETTTVTPWAPVGIAHYQLLIDKNVTDKLEFVTKEVSNGVSPDKILQYAQIIAGTKSGSAERERAVDELEGGSGLRFLASDRENPSQLAFRINSPYLMPVFKQCWVLLELDPAVTNWQFEKGQHSVTCKHLADKWDFGLIDVYPGGAWQTDGALDNGTKAMVEDDFCRVVFFGVAKRAAKPSNDCTRFFNLHTEFLQGSLATQRRLKVIFDPDVPNDGTSAFP